MVFWYVVCKYFSVFTVEPLHSGDPCELCNMCVLFCRRWLTSTTKALEKREDVSNQTHFFSLTQNMDSKRCKIACEMYVCVAKLFRRLRIKDRGPFCGASYFLRYVILRHGSLPRLQTDAGVNCFLSLLTSPPWSKAPANATYFIKGSIWRAYVALFAISICFGATSTMSFAVPQWGC